MLQLSSLAGLAAILLISKFIYGLIYNLFISPLAAQPGPKLWAVSRLPLGLAQLRGDTDRRLLRLHQQYGHVVRVGPTTLSYTNETVWRDVFAHRQGHQEFMKWNTLAPPNGVRGLLSAEREDHARFRKLLSHAFSEKGLREQEPRIMSHVNLMMQKLRENASSGSQDIVSWFNWVTFDMIGDLAFGESFGCLENTRQHFWVEAIFGNVKYLVIARSLVNMGLAWAIPIVTPKKAIQWFRKNQDFANEKIAQRLRVEGPRGDFFDYVLKKKAGEGGMTEPELASNASNLVLGGSETTATLLSGTIHLLLKNQDILAKAKDEVRNTFSSDDDITIVGVNQLSYMLAVLQEAMRIYPPVPVLQLRRVPAGGDTVDGVLLPAETLVIVSMYAAYRLEANFARPDQFHPERWTLNDKEKSKSQFANDNTAVLQPFSVGTRNCIGRNLAYAEMRLILAKLLYNFDIAHPDQEPQHDWIDCQRTWVLWEKGPLWVRLTPRKT